MAIHVSMSSTTRFFSFFSRAVRVHMWVWGHDREHALRRAKEVQKELRRVFEAAGMLLHKEELGFLLELVGLRNGKLEAAVALELPLQTLPAFQRS